MTKQVTISNSQQLSEYKEILKKNIDATMYAIKNIVMENSSFDAIALFKYEKTVTEALTGEDENLIEFLNQTQTYLVSIMAVECLMKLFPDKEFIVNFGNIPGHDILSTDEEVIAECFAVANFRNNRKLISDLDRLVANESALHKFVFFHDKVFDEYDKEYQEEKYPGIQIVKFDNVTL